MNKEQAARQGDVRALKAQGVEAGERLKADKAALQEAAAERDEFVAMRAGYLMYAN